MYAPQVYESPAEKPKRRTKIKDEYRPNNPVRVEGLGLYDRRRLRRRTGAPRYVFDTVFLDLPDLCDEDGEIVGPSTQAVAEAEIESSDTNMGLIAYEPDIEPVRHSDPALTIAGAKRIQYCTGATSDLRVSFTLDVFSNELSREYEVSVLEARSRITICLRAVWSWKHTPPASVAW